MKRWVRSSSMAAALACAGWSAAQGPPVTAAVPTASPAQAGGPQEGDIIVFRTAGQPERRVKVIKISRFEDGEVLADVQDQTSGDSYTLPLRAASSAPRLAAGATPISVPASSGPGYQNQTPGSRY